jgi:exo-beta-1,3-glucanase (GH17 family)
MDRILSTGLREIRTYGCNFWRGPIVEEAEARNIGVILGAYITEAYTIELDIAIDLANAHPNVHMIVVGNETQTPWSINPMPEEDLLAYMAYVRERVNVPVTTGEHSQVWLSRQATLGAAADVILVQNAPFRTGFALEGIVDGYINGVHQDLLAAYANKPMVWGETGWPSGGPTLGDAVPSPENQARYTREIMAWAERNQVPLYLFAYADAPYDPTETDAHWGLLTLDYWPKPAWYELPSAKSWLPFALGKS